VFLTIFFITAYFMLCKPTGGRVKISHIAYITALLSVTTVNVATGMKWNQMIWIDNRNYPGGPLAFVNMEFSNWVNVLSSASYTVNNFLADGLVLYRCLVIWHDNYLVVAFPVLMFLASTALSIITVFQTAQPGASLWTKVTVNFALPYWSLSISLNIIVTLLIAGRLLVVRKALREALGAEHAKKYTSAIAMLIESAALYSITSIVFIITYARNSYVQNLVLPVLCSVMPTAPLLILLRVASGNGFSRNTTVELAQTSKGSADRSYRPASGNSTEKTAMSSEGKTTLAGGEWEWNRSKTSGHQFQSDV